MSASAQFITELEAGKQRVEGLKLFPRKVLLTRYNEIGRQLKRGKLKLSTREKEEKRQERMYLELALIGK